MHDTVAIKYADSSNFSFYSWFIFAAVNCIVPMENKKDNQKFKKKKKSHKS